MKKIMVLAVTLVCSLLSGCNGNAKRNNVKNQQRYIVKLIKENDSCKLGADGLSDDEFNKYAGNESLIPGDVIVITTYDDLSVIKTFEKTVDKSDTYLAPVMRLDYPDGPGAHSKYSYDIVFLGNWEDYLGRQTGGISHEYILSYNRHEDMAIKQDRSVINIADLRDKTEFYCLFDQSCVSENSDYNQYIVSPLSFILNE